MKIKTEHLEFEIAEDLIEYPISKELKKLSETLEQIYKKSNNTLVWDLLKDLHDSFTPIL